MRQNQFNMHSAALRIGCLIAAATVTAVLVSSQYGIAEVYNVQAEAMQGVRRGDAMAQQTAAPVASSPRHANSS